MCGVSADGAAAAAAGGGWGEGGRWHDDSGVRRSVGPRAGGSLGWGLRIGNCHGSGAYRTCSGKRSQNRPE